MVYRPHVKNDLCFVLLPLRNPFLGYFEKILKPAAAEVGLRAVKADDIYGTGVIIRDIWDQIWRAKAVIAIVTDKNPNVNYELGICHSLGIPTILITEKKEDVPFDYQHRRYIQYQPQEAGWEQKLREDVTKTLKADLAGVELDADLPWPYDTYLLKEPRRLGSLMVSGDSHAMVLRGVSLVADSVALAFGPNGRKVSITQRMGSSSEKRGVSIANSLRSSDPLEAKGIEAMQRLASEMANSIGDGTKTAILIAHELITAGYKGIQSGVAPKQVVSGMRSGIDTAIAHILTGARPCDGKDIERIARTASGSKATAAIITEAMRRVGPDGVISIEDSTDNELALEVAEGLQFDRGFISPGFVTDQERQQCLLEDCLVLIYDAKLGSLVQVLPVLELVAKAAQPLLIICDDLGDEVLATILVNNNKGTLQAAAVKTPGLGDRKRATLEDIAVVTGGKAFIQETLIPLSRVELGDFGQAKRIIVTKDETTILEGGGSVTAIEAKIKQLRKQIAASSALYDQEKLRERLARIASGIAVIKVGALTPSDQAELRYQIASALHSCSSAIVNGWVIGGGIQLVHATPFVEKLVAEDRGEQTGIEAVSKALERPLRQLLRNGDHKHADDVVAAVRQDEKRTLGFNAETGQSNDLVRAGIIDPARTLKEALLLAFAHAKGILETGAWDVSTAKTNSAEEQN
jgi:chaperonin GroEL